jgi:hypothetical protein
MGALGITRPEGTTMLKTTLTAADLLLAATSAARADQIENTCSGQHPHSYLLQRLCVKQEVEAARQIREYLKK